jgi:hypothetical protein
MLEFFLAGGVAMLPILVFGVLAIVAAVAFARKPDERRFAMVRALSATTVFGTLAGVAACIGAVMTKIPSNPEWAHSPDLSLIVMTGLGESMSPPIMGFALLAVAWLVVAVGWRRMPAADT